MQEYERLYYPDIFSRGSVEEASDRALAELDPGLTLADNHRSWPSAGAGARSRAIPGRARGQHPLRDGDASEALAIMCAMCLRIQGPR